MRIENSYPASPFSAGKLASEMRSLGLPEESVKRTWEHEQAHKASDPEGNSKGGEYGYTVDIEVNDYFIIASYVAYYSIFGEREPEDLVAIAEGPGFGEMSEQDWKVREHAWRQWVENIEEEKRKASINKNGSEQDNENSPKIPLLVAIPRQDGEDDEKYSNKVDLVQEFAKRLEDLSDEVRIPSVSEIMQKGIVNLEKEDYEEIRRAYYEALETVSRKKEDEDQLSKEPSEEKSDDREDDVERKNSEDETKVVTIYSSFRPDRQLAT
jgi:hypothetical protein